MNKWIWYSTLTFVEIKFPVISGKEIDMKTITITVEDKKSDALIKHLESLDEVDYIEVYNDDEVTPVEIKVWEQRWENYTKNPSTARTAEQVKKRIKDEFGI